MIGRVKNFIVAMAPHRLVTPRGFARAAVAACLLYAACHVLGWREHTAILSGTAPAGEWADLSVLLGIVYVATYFGFVLVAADLSPGGRDLRPAAARLAIGSPGFLKYDNAWPPPVERVLPFLHGLVGLARWSHTVLTRPVEIPLRWVIQREPSALFSTPYTWHAAPPDSPFRATCSPHFRQLDWTASSGEPGRRLLSKETAALGIEGI